MNKSYILHIHKHKRKNLCYNTIDRRRKAEIVPSYCQPDKVTYSYRKEEIIMVKQVKISNFDEVKSIMNAAARCHDDIGVHDSRGSIADAKSILGLMSLDYTKPVMLVSENERELESVLRALS